MVLNVKPLTVDDVVQILIDTVKKPAYKTTAESQKRIEDLALAMKVQAELVKLVPKVEVEADAGHVFVNAFGENVPKSKTLVAKIKVIAEGVDGVGEVTLNIPGKPGPQTHVNPFHNIA
ncbi:MAG: hypothetical protein ABIL58_23710 [Pseudomonadota bacterium]